MSCELVERDLDAYLDRELDAEASAALREHVRTCAACRRQLAQRETLARLVRSAPYYSAPDRLRARVLAQSTRSPSVASRPHMGGRGGARPFSRRRDDAVATGIEPRGRNRG